LTAARPILYGVSATGLLGDARVTLSNIRVDGTTISFDAAVQAVQSETRVGLNIELLPAGLVTGPSTEVTRSGVSGALPSCGDATSSQHCVYEIFRDRMHILFPQTIPAVNFRISGLESTMNPCAALPNGDPCPEGTCWESPVPDIGKQCFSDCRKQYFQSNYDSIAVNPSSLPGESGFCINAVSRARCGGTKNQYWDTTEGLCPEGKKCCTKGDGRVPSS
jgi:hypothetical protein